MISNFINKKIIRLRNSSKILKLLYFYHYVLYDKKLGNIGFDFSNKKSRINIVKDIIKKKTIKNT